MRLQTSEGLAEADINLNRRIVASVHRRGRHVQAHRPERRVVPQPQSGPPENATAEPGYARRVNIAGVDKRNDTDRVDDLDAHFDTELGAGLAADWSVVDVERSGPLVPIRPKRAAAAG